MICIHAADDFEGRVIQRLGRALVTAPTVDTGHWQAMKDVPQTKTIELQDVVVEVPVPSVDDPAYGNVAMLELQRLVSPNLPWAEDHFQERVSGQPLNPPPSHVNWPFAQQGNAAHMDKKFSHTYPERMWPRFAEAKPDDLGLYDLEDEKWGIRYRYGDLRDVIELLLREPTTRQAYLPLWFPEDTGAVEHQRVPCTLGYHFMLRDGKLDCRYVIRSCDFFRHFRDDVYMASRLLQWVLASLQDNDTEWDGVRCGTMTMWAFSFHVFEPERGKLRREFL